MIDGWGVGRGWQEEKEQGEVNMEERNSRFILGLSQPAEFHEKEVGLLDPKWKLALKGVLLIQKSRCRVSH